jgi:plasmid stabilization system protein ParE
MSFIVNWDLIALDSFIKEAEFILLKWNLNEVERFNELVEENLFRLAINPLIGKFNKDLKLYALVISKQTTLYYNFDENTKIIDLYAFWNNSKNPNDLAKLL